MHLANQRAADIAKHRPANQKAGNCSKNIYRPDIVVKRRFGPIPKSDPYADQNTATKADDDLGADENAGHGNGPKDTVSAACFSFLIAKNGHYYDENHTKPPLDRTKSNQNVGGGGGADADIGGSSGTFETCFITSHIPTMLMIKNTIPRINA